MNQSGSQNSNWKGGKYYNRGYLMILIPSHPRADSKGYVRAHIVKAEKALGKPLPVGAVVHHHSDKQLVVCQDQAYHLNLHARTRSFIATSFPDHRHCTDCDRWYSISEFYGKSGQCKKCAYIRSRKWVKKNTDYLRVYYADYRARNREKLRLYKREWRRKCQKEQEHTNVTN